jgi:hypothetical protein
MLPKLDQNIKVIECPDKFFAALGDMHDAELEFFWMGNSQ